ncbi:MAG: YqaA family protein [Hyphomicrobiaceae bacterium]
MMRQAYDWAMRLAASDKAIYALFFVAFVESSVFPIPPDIMLIPMVLANRHRAWYFAGLCTIASVLGGLLGYAIGYYLFDLIGIRMLDFYGYSAQFKEFAAEYNKWGAWIVLFAGVTPFPYKVITIASGTTALSLPVFLMASVVARGLRFFVVAGLLYWFGPPIQAFIEKRLGLVMTVFFVLLFGAFVVLRFLK